MAKRTLALTALLGINYTSAFTQPAPKYSFARSNTLTRPLRLTPRESHDDMNSTFNPFQMGDSFRTQNEENGFDQKVALASTLVFLASNPAVANAAGPEWGIFEGRTGSLLHPAMMAGMFLFSISTGILGFQIRQTRELGNEISKLKKSIPKFEGSDLKSAIAEAESAESVDFRYVESLKSSVTVQAEIDELTKKRKDLVASGPRDKHFGQGALLAFLGTAFAIEGPLNTYARAGKLFPGPHLYAGAGLVVLWALAAACVPAMQKGSDTARSIHIGANAVGVGLFGWQVLTGWPILLKVIEKTQWP